MAGLSIDSILFNGNLITIDLDQPRAQAVAISQGRFLAVGSNDEIKALATGDTKKIDLGGRTVVPGFIDSHCHPALAGRQHLRNVACDLATNADIREAIRTRASKTPPGEWVMGFLYDDTKHSHPLTLQELDAITPRHPVYISYRGGHTAVVNSAALKMAEVTESTPDPAGGGYSRDSATGKMNGRLDETAREPFWKVMPSQFTCGDFREGVKLISRMMCSTGITSVGDAALAGPDDLRAYQDAYEAGALNFRVYCFINSKYVDHFLAARIRTGMGNEWLRIGAMKMFCDGSISERTARLCEPYNGSHYYGLFSADEEELYGEGRKAQKAGWQIAVHANGDAAIARVLNVYERLQREIPRHDPRYRIEHCTVIDPAIVERIRTLKAIPVPFSSYVNFHGEKMHFYGEERLCRMFAVRSFLDAGLRPSASSDYTASPFNPMLGIQSMVTRTDPKGNVWGSNQRISVEEALRVSTINGAYASYEEGIKGSIEHGKLADLAVLSADPTIVDPLALSSIRCERTMLGGRWVFES
jgi:predicted amidohydrolase YtcJ